MITPKLSSAASMSCQDMRHHHVKSPAQPADFRLYARLPASAWTHNRCCVAGGMRGMDLRGFASDRSCAPCPTLRPSRSDMPAAEWTAWQPMTQYVLQSASLDLCGSKLHAAEIRLKCCSSKRVNVDVTSGSGQSCIRWHAQAFMAAYACMPLVSHATAASCS